MQADNIILFDGSCAFCNGFIRRILKVDRVRFRLCDQQSRQFTLIAQAHRLPLSAGKDAGTIYLIQGGKAYTRAAAISRILRGCKLPYRMMGRLLQLVPQFISNFVYDWIAQRRHRIIMSQVCTLPSPEMKQRVI
jgi:predicted DCC family thiol-disulfide oxidoreductase YuxK